MAEKPGVLEYRSRQEADDGWFDWTDRRYPGVMLLIAVLLTGISYQFSELYWWLLSTGLVFFFVTFILLPWYILAGCARRFEGRPLLILQAFLGSMGVTSYAAGLMKVVWTEPRANWAIFFWWVYQDRFSEVAAILLVLAACVVWLILIFGFERWTRRDQGGAGKINAHDPHTR